MKSLQILLVSGISLLLCASVDAQRKGKGKGKRGGGNSRFEQLDKNSDGKITESEAEGTRISARFAKLDANSDGAITKAELSAAKGSGRKGRRGKGKGRKRGGKD
jgi:hypothetical protein